MLDCPGSPSPVCSSNGSGFDMWNKWLKKLGNENTPNIKKPSHGEYLTGDPWNRIHTDGSCGYFCVAMRNNWKRACTDGGSLNDSNYAKPPAPLNGNPSPTSVPGLNEGEIIALAQPGKSANKAFFTRKDKNTNDVTLGNHDIDSLNKTITNGEPYYVLVETDIIVNGEHVNHWMLGIGTRIETTYTVYEKTECTDPDCCCCKWEEERRDVIGIVTYALCIDPNDPKTVLPVPLYTQANSGGAPSVPTSYPNTGKHGINRVIGAVNAK